MTDTPIGDDVLAEVYPQHDPELDEDPDEVDMDVVDEVDDVIDGDDIPREDNNVDETDEDGG